MTIQEQNIVFLASQVMDDVPEGGGAATGNVVQDGLMNNVFEDISDLDRTYGRFNLRKLAVGVRTASTELFGGAKTFVTHLPDDVAISYALFGTSDPFDRRADAAGRVEAYLNVGSELPGYLLENHIAGQRSIQIFQRPTAAPPEPGQTLVLKNSTREQYVRATRVNAETRTFTYSSNNGFVDYDAAVVTVEISDALRYDFYGSPPARDFARTSTGTSLREVVVADAARYYGGVRLNQPAGVGDMSCRAESIFARLVPSSQTEIPLVDRALAGDTQPMIRGSAGVTAYSATVSLAPGGRISLPTPCWPGTLGINLGLHQLTDDGLGVVLNNGAVIGSIAYTTGEISLGAGAPTASGPASITYGPAAPVTLPSHTLMRPVTEANRAYTWVVPLKPQVSPGSLVISYQAQGRWYTLRDNALGVIAGSESGFGSGSINYGTATVNVTLGALPDAGSAVLFAWGTPAEYLPLTTSGLGIEAPRVAISLASGNCEPGTLAISWLSGGVTVTATDDGAGVITGAGSGRIYYGSGGGYMVPNVLPDVGAQYAISYQAASAMGGQVDGGALPGGGTTYTTTLADPPRPGSVEITLQLLQTTSSTSGNSFAVVTQNTVPATVRDNGVGGLMLDGVLLAGSSINYTTGALVVAINRIVQRPVAQFSEEEMSRPNGLGGTYQYKTSVMSGYAIEGVTQTIAPGGVSVRYKAADAVDTPVSEAVSAPVFEISLRQTLGGAIVPNSLSFRLNNKLYADRDGVLMHSIDPATGVGMLAGSINYQTGMVSISAWAPGALQFELVSGLVNPGVAGQAQVSGRTAARPIKPGSLFVSAVKLEGGSITATAGSDGSFSGDLVRGYVDIESGIYSLQFGQYVPDPANPTGPEIWRSILVDPTTLRYNTVAYTYLPLDAGVLGIDPVRLPADGRVPIFRVGDVAHILHTASTTGTPSYSGGKYSLSCGRIRLAWVKITDANGNPITSGYELDRATGLVSFSSLSGIATPITVRHTVSDLRQITDVQITGHLSFARPLTHDYPAGESIISSCLIHGDRRARVSAVWDQQTWNNSWSDSLQGSEAVGTLDTIAHPITVTNEGAETERWLLRWLTSTNVELIGQTRGLVFSGPFTADIAPINPRTRNPDGTGGVPYLTIPVAANGGGWAASNVVRINTVGAIAPFWIARAIQQSDAPLGDGADGCEIACIGNINRP